MPDYIRDKRSPKPSSEIVSKTMSSNKGKGTGPELVLRKALRNDGLTGYRLHWDISGKPDICYPGRKIAIFVNGCFWHRCPLCNLPLPKHNIDFWRTKFERNVRRDIENNERLLKDGWTVITIWGCEIKNNLQNVVKMIKDYL